ncbi:MAG: hypothetical protein GH151_01960 [Bacteroidetes bacterium]|nr:hypothetical protein [Bacteroidota bacterium]
MVLSFPAISNEERDTKNDTLKNSISLQDLKVLQGKTDTILHAYLLREVQKQFDIRRH